MAFKKVVVAVLLAVILTLSIGTTTISPVPLVAPIKMSDVGKHTTVKKLVIKPKIEPKEKPVIEELLKRASKPSIKPVASIVDKPVIKPIVKAAAKPVQTYYRKTARGLEISKYEYDLLVRVAHSEAGGDGMASQIGVVNVVLNRVHFGGWFPTNIAGVIYQKGQFSVVADGRINEPVEAMNYTAVDRVIAGENNIGNCQFFWAEYVDKSNFLWSKAVLYKYGTTVFAN